MKLVFALIAAAVVAGCASNPADMSSGERLDTAKALTVQATTLAYIKQVPAAERPQRAARIAKATTAVLEIAHDGEITLQRLVELAAEQIPATADPADRLLAMNLIKLVQNELQRNLGAGGLQSDTVVKLSELLENVLLVASLYQTPG